MRLRDQFRTITPADVLRALAEFGAWAMVLASCFLFLLVIEG